MQIFAYKAKQHSEMDEDNKIFPAITIQCDWNDIIKLPGSKGWISSKYLNQISKHEELTTSVSQSDGKIKINLPQTYEYISHGNLNLVMKHVPSGLKVAFVAATKAHQVHSKAVLSVSAAENALAVSSFEDDRLLVWDSRTSEVLQELKGHGGPAYKCRFFPSGVVVLSAGADGSCRIWSAESGINPVILKGHKMAVTDVCIVDKGRNVISVSKDGTAKLWDVGESNCLDDILQGLSDINCCAITETDFEFPVDNEREIATENKIIVVGCENGLIVAAQVALRERKYTVQLNSPCNACAAFDECFIVGCSNGMVIQMNIQDGTTLRKWHDSASPVLSIIALPNEMFVVGRQDGTCTILSVQQQHEAIRVHLTGSDCDGIRDLSFNGKWIFAGCRDSNIRKYDFNQVIVHFK